MLSPEQIEARKHRLGGSDVACLMTGDEAAMLNLYYEKVEDPRYKPKDLSRVWAVQLGTVTEQLNLDWYEYKTGRHVTRRGEVVTHRAFPWAAATLDGFDEAKSAPIECKHVGGREPLLTVIQRYQPQFHWLMTVTRSEVCYASIIEGTNEPVIERITFNKDYGKELWIRAQAFWLCVETRTPPVAEPPVEPPTEPIKVYNMNGLNSWAMFASQWQQTEAAAKLFAEAEREIKLLVPPDAKAAFGNSIHVKRDRANRLRIERAKEDATSTMGRPSENNAF